MSFEFFMLMMLIVSTLTGLVTEAAKKQLQEMGKKYYANALAGGVSVVLSVFVGSAYVILTEAVINGRLAVYLIALMLLSWLSAMVGYDKVIQAISQFNYNEKKEG